MGIRLRKTVLRVMILVVIFALLSANTCRASSYLQYSPIKVDVFTQEEPYSGKGPNMPSDAFGPQDIVILYALVTNSDSSMGHTLVGFNVEMPDNTHFGISALTNMSGIATVNFRIPIPSSNVSEDDIFGTWIVTASVLVEGEVYQDTLSFKVDWVVKLLSVETTDENVTNLDHFGKGGDVGLNITLRSIAMTLRNATIAITVEDELDVVVNSSIIQGFVVPPNERVVSLYCKATLPKYAYTGNATVSVSAFHTAPNGTIGPPYCPKISTTFRITDEPIEIDYNDAAVVTVLPSAKTIEIGQSLTLETIVRTEGTVAESFNVSTYFDKVILGTSQVTNLLPYSTAIFRFAIDTSLLTIGNHTISAHIPPLIKVKEIDLKDNDFSDTIVVKPKPPSVIHDVGVTDVTLSSNSVFIGGLVEINVTVLNNGTELESFGLSTYYNSSLIETRQVHSLAPLSEVLVTFSWNTSQVSVGLYQIKAYAALPDNETDPSPGDNTLIDGFVLVKPVPSALQDIGVIRVTLSTNTTFIGGVVEIYVTVKNNGTAVETFLLRAYYNSSLINTIQINALKPDENVTATFSWNTGSAKEGVYQISAVAPLTGDPSPGDNTLTDGFVQLKSPAKPVPYAPSFLFLEGFFILMSALGIIASLILLLMLGFLRRRRKKKLPRRYTLLVHLHI